MERVYVLVDPRVTDPVLRIRYVGWTRQSLSRRLSGHLSTARCSTKTKMHRLAWIRSVMRAGFTPGIELYAEIPAGHGAASEVAAIRLLRLLDADLTNGTAGGDGVVGHVHSEQTRRRLSEAHTGRRLPQGHREKLAEHWRRFWSDPESRAKALKAKLGHLVTREGRANMSAAQRGHPVSDAQRAKIAATLTGRKASDATRAKQSAAIRAYYSNPAAREHMKQQQARALRPNSNLEMF